MPENLREKQGKRRRNGSVLCWNATKRAGLQRNRKKWQISWEKNV